MKAKSTLPATPLVLLLFTFGAALAPAEKASLPGRLLWSFDTGG